MVVVDALTVAADEPVRPAEIREELERVLGSPEFRASPRRKQMLGYLVEEVLAGRSAMLKGYAIGVSVFQRGEDFDAQADPVVRLEARRLRRDLDSYYVSEGRWNPLRISIPKGNYAPVVYRSEQDYPAPETAATVSAAGRAIEEQPPAQPQLRATRENVSWGRRLAPAVALLALTALVATGMWMRRQEVPGAQPLAQGPSVMVLPFEVAGGTSENLFLAAGMADQIVTDLSRFPDFRIYLPAAGLQDNSSEDALAAGSRGGVSYVVSGRVSSEAGKIRISARLQEVPSGLVIWTENYDRPMAPESLLAIQGEIAGSVSTALGQPYGVIKSEITKQLSEDFSPSMPSYECVLRGYAYRRDFSRKLFGPTLDCLESAVKRDPDYADAWAMLGWLHLDSARFGLTDNVGSAYDQALDAAQRAVSLDGRNILALKALASINHYLGNFDEGERIQRQALALNPNDPDTLAQLGWRLAVRGNFKDGIPYLKHAIDRTVNPPGWYYHLIAIDHYLNGRYADMLDAARRGAIDGSGISWSFVAIANAALGNRKDAQEALARMTEISPRLARDPGAVYRMHGAVDSIVDPLVEGLRKAGWTDPLQARS